VVELLEWEGTHSISDLEHRETDQANHPYVFHYFIYFSEISASKSGMVVHT
jgi:hypothetical protein